MAGANVYYLKGGPCDGKTGEISPEMAQTGQTTCGGHVYKEDAADSSHRPYIVFKDAGKVPTQKGGPTAARTHHGWTDIRHSVNHAMPASLRAAQHSTAAALRSIARARKVRL